MRRCRRCYQSRAVGRHGLSHCPFEPRREQTNLCGRDQYWNFVTTGWHPKLPAGIRVSSARQWEAVTRRYGVTGDLDVKERVRRRDRDSAGKAWKEQRVHMRAQIGRVLRDALGQQQRLVRGG